MWRPQFSFCCVSSTPTITASGFSISSLISFLFWLFFSFVFLVVICWSLFPIVERRKKRLGKSSPESEKGIREKNKKHHEEVKLAQHQQRPPLRQPIDVVGVIGMISCHLDWWFSLCRIVCLMLVMVILIFAWIFFIFFGELYADSPLNKQRGGLYLPSSVLLAAHNDCICLCSSNMRDFPPSHYPSPRSRTLDIQPIISFTISSRSGILISLDCLKFVSCSINMQTLLFHDGNSLDWLLIQMSLLADDGPVIPVLTIETSFAYFGILLEAFTSSSVTHSAASSSSISPPPSAPRTSPISPLTAPAKSEFSFSLTRHLMLVYNSSVAAYGFYWDEAGRKSISDWWMSGQVGESWYQRSNEYPVPLLLRSAIWYEELFDLASDSSYVCLAFVFAYPGKWPIEYAKQDPKKKKRGRKDQSEINSL